MIGMKRWMPEQESTTDTTPLSIRVSPRLREEMTDALEEGETYGEFIRPLIEQEVARRSVHKRERRGKKA